MKNNKVQAGIIGAAGYTGGETLRLLLNHPHAEISFAMSRSHAGQPLWLVHPDLLGETGMKFSDTIERSCDVLFLCLGHGESEKFLEEITLPSSCKVIDLSQDHRLGKTGADRKFVYGLPEKNREQISGASAIANPGCFATQIQLALLPLAEKGLLKGEVHISATTGSTGAGHSFTETTHFSRRSNNLSVYKAFGHQHLAEVMNTLTGTQPDTDVRINFIPYRGAFTRGIMAGIYLDFDGTNDEARSLFNARYASEPFVIMSENEIDLKQVVNTNKCILHVQKHGSKLMISGAIDNLLKGASGQAVQNMNIAFGLEETSGLRLKAVAF